MSWQMLVGGLIGAALGYLGSRVAPRWMDSRPRLWEGLAMASIAGILAGLLAAEHPLDGYYWQQVTFMAILLTASLVDLHDKIIPNELVLFGLAAGLLLLFIAPYPQKSWVEALAGAGAGFGVLLLLALIVRGGMGLGDVKLAAVIGLFLGIRWVGMGLVLAFIAGGLVGGLLLLFRVLGRKDSIPFGPYLALGALITVLYGLKIWIWYTSV